MPRVALAVLVATLFTGCADQDALVAELQGAVSRHDAALTESLLRRGVDPRAQTTDGEVPLKTALEVIAGAPDWATALQELDLAAPEIQVMRHVMRYTRRFSQTSIETVGVVSVQIMEGEYVPDRGQQFVTSVVMEADTGDQYELWLSTWETDYLEVDYTDGGQPILRPGGRYRVVGAVGETTFNTRSVVEVESIELISPPEGTSQMLPPIQYFLPSTAEQMQAWLR